MAAVIESHAPLLVPENSRDPELRAHALARQVRDHVACPLVMGEEVIGTITVMNRIGDVSTFGVEDLRVFETLTNHAAVSLEITETHVIVEPEVTLKVLHELAGLGVSLAIDDFGTGYSSLAYLARLPVDEIKIDKSFVLAMIEDTSARTIVRSVIELARNLGHKVIAEGVEDQVTWDALAELGCDLAQGYYLSRPTTAELRPWLLARNPGRLRIVPTVALAAP